MSWGVMLVSYQGMGAMNMWCVQDGGGLSKEEANAARDDYARRNPKGVYEVRELPVKPGWIRSREL